MDVDAEAEVEFQLLKFLPGLFVIIARLVMHFQFLQEYNYKHNHIDL